MTQVTIVGNLVDTPELRFTPQGKAVANFTVAVSKRVKDGNDWKDGPSSFYRCALWDAAAENLSESLEKGQRVIVVGEIAQRSFEAKGGEKRSTFEITASEVGPSVKWATVSVVKAGSKGATKPKPKPAADDPWGSAPAADAWGNTDEAPF
jgi:single-strand DNA-binding protein